jgi:hypothetical protein
MKNTFLPDLAVSVTKPLTMKVDIQGVREPVIYEYFARLNNGKFIATAELFSEQGCLNPPFDKQLQGRSAIAQYLEKEAKGVRFFPEYGKIVTSIDTASNLEHGDRLQYQIQGKVEMNWFTVEVSWSIELNTFKEIMLVEVNLLTSLNDLLSFSHI